jgi:ATP-dependent DNA helicase RecQ
MYLFSKQSKLIFTIQRDELYKFSGFSNTVENLIKIILRSYTGLFADYIHINETLLSQRTGMSEKEIYESLQYLSSQHIIHYVPAQKVPTIYYNTNREDIKYLSIPQNVYELRRNKLVHRIEHVIEYGSSKTQCRSKMLLHYFGEKTANNCGKCDVCLANKAENRTDTSMNLIFSQILDKVEISEMPIEEIIASIDYPEKQVIDALRFLSDSEQIVITDNKIKKKTNKHT